MTAPGKPYSLSAVDARSPVKIYVGNQWSKQDWESDISFEAFRMFRGMGYRRTLVRVAKKVGKCESLIHRWSAEFQWRDRCAAYDADLDKLAQLRHRKAVAAMTDQHAKVAKILIGKLTTRLATMDINALEPRDLVRWLDVAVRIERLSRGADDVMRDRIPPTPRTTA